MSFRLLLVITTFGENIKYMSDFSSNSTINLSVNGQGVEEKLKKYEKQLVELRNKAQHAAEIGDKGTLQKTQKEIRKVENEMRKVRTATANVEDTLRNLDKATPKQLKKDLQTLKAQLNGLERGSEAWNAHIQKIKLLQTELKRINSEMKVQEGFWDRLNRKMNDWQTTLAAGAAASTGVIMAGRSAVNAYAEMDAEMANVRKFTGMTAEQVEDLNEEFLKMDTRTAREELNKLAQEAGRLGKQTKEDVLGFVKAADVINVALDDLGEGATLTLSKLTNIFGDEKIYGTEQSLLKVGSVINELSQNCTAAAPYLAQFAQRLAGVGAQAKMTIPQIMGYAAVLDSQGQAVEMSATALSKLIMDLFKDSAKIAKATGIDLQQFNEALKKSTNEGLLMLLDRLHELGNIDVLAPVFKDMGEDGARASAVIAALAGNIDKVKWEQEEANKAYEEGTSVIKEFNVQNTTVQAGLDKAKKGFNEMAVELGKELMPVMSHIISSTSVIMRLMSTGIKFVKDNAEAIITLTAAFVAYRIAVNASNIAFKIHYGYLVVSKAATTAYTAVTKSLTAAKLLLSLAVAKLNGNYAKQQLIMTNLSKLGKSVASGYGLIAAAAIALGVAIYKAVQRMTEMSKTEKTLADIRKKANDAIQDQKFKLEQLRKVAKDENAALKDRLSAIDQLNKIVPGYNASLDTTTGKYTESTKALKKYNDELVRKYEIEGAESKLKELGGRKADLKLQNVYDEKKLKEQEKSARSAVTPASVSASTPYAMTSMDVGSTVVLSQIRKRINARKEELQQIEEEEKILNNIYGKDFAKKFLEENKEEETQQGGEGDGDGDDDKKKADKFAKEKAWKDKELALNRIAYATGKEDYEEYQKAILEIEQEYQSKILEHKDLTEQESLEAQASFHEAEMKLRQNAINQNKEDADAMYAELKAKEDQRYADGQISAKQHDKAVRMLELKHLREIVNIYEEGSKERNEAEKRYEAAMLEDKMRNRKSIEDMEKEHQKKLDEIRKGVFSDTPTKQKEMYDADIAALTTVYEQEKIAAAGSKEDLLKIEENFQKAKQVLAYKYNQVTLENGFNQFEVANAKLLEWMESEQGQKVLETYDIVMEGMTNLFSACSDLVQAELDIEVAAIQKRYEKEISAAEGNQYKVKRLQEKQQKEEAAAKNKANKKMFAMQVMQAIASTAMAAINAYASASQTYWLLGPIAAAMAVAAGAIQIANIKKQQQASEAQGYAEGGYTGSGGKYEPRGIVHAGEWVASQKLLANPQTAAIIQALDYAQKNNTIGSISSDMVSSDTTAASAIARMGITSSNSDNSLGNTLQQLNRRLNEPFVTVNTMTGDHGIVQAQEEYDIYIRNKTPKSRRQ